MMWQGIDPVSIFWDCKDTKLRPTGRNTVLGSHLPLATHAADRTSSPPNAATCPGKHPSAPYPPSASTAPSASNGQTPAWSASTAPPKPSPDALVALKKYDYPASQTSFNAAFSSKE